MCIALPTTCLGNNVVISSTSQPKIHVAKQYDYRGHVYGEYLSFHFKENSLVQNPVDIESEQCLEVNGTMSAHDDISGFDMDTMIGGWGQRLQTGQATAAYIAFDATLTNTCRHNVRGYVGIYGTTTSAAMNTALVDVPAVTTCGITIHDPVKLGPLYPGENNGQRISVASGGYGHGRLTLSPTMKQNNQGLLTSPGGGTLSYVLASDGGAAWDRNVGGLVGDLDQNFVAYASTVPSDEVGGDYSGSLTAVVACE